MPVRFAKHAALKAVILLLVWAMLPLLIGETKVAQRLLSPLAATNHVGEQATVCGKVVTAKISKYGVAGHGKPITFFMAAPETNPVFFFVALSPDPTKLEQTKEAYLGKQVCVSGKITKIGNVPDMIVTEPSQIEVKSDK